MGRSVPAAAVRGRAQGAGRRTVGLWATKLAGGASAARSMLLRLAPFSAGSTAR